MPRSRSRSRSRGRRRRSRSRSRDRDRRSRSRGRDDDYDTEILDLEGDAVAYILGRDGSTKRRLENSSGCRLEVGHDKVELIGSKKERELARFFVNMTLQQRRGAMSVNFRDVEAREDCETLDVPKECVGFVLGTRGATLRNFEERSRAYMVFDNESLRDGTKRLYVIGPPRSREQAMHLVQDAVDFRLRKDTGGGGGGGGRRRRRSRSRSRGRRRRYSRSRSRSRGRRRRYSRSRSRGRRSRSRGRHSRSRSRSGSRRSRSKSGDKGGSRSRSKSPSKKAAADTPEAAAAAAPAAAEAT